MDLGGAKKICRDISDRLQVEGSCVKTSFGTRQFIERFQRIISILSAVDCGHRTESHAICGGRGSLSFIDERACNQGRDLLNRSANASFTKIQLINQWMHPLLFSA